MGEYTEDNGYLESDYKAEPPAVKVGQIWQGLDIRWRGDEPGRLLRVVRIEGDYAFCAPPRREKPVTRIRLDRFRPTSMGYRLVKDA